MMKTVASAELHSTAAVRTVGHLSFTGFVFFFNLLWPEHTVCKVLKWWLYLAWMDGWMCVFSAPVRYVLLLSCVQVKSPETTARWCGVSAHTVSTCTASWSGWTRSRCSSSAPCVDRSGSLKSEDLAVRLVYTISSAHCLCLNAARPHRNVCSFLFPFRGETTWGDGINNLQWQKKKIAALFYSSVHRQ